MKLLPFISSALLASGFVFSLNAQSVTTDPVGYVTFAVNANSDQRLGVPMQRPSVFAGAATSISQQVVQASGIESLSEAHFLLVTSGDAEGQWEEIVSSSSGEVTLAASIANFSVGDSFTIRPFWTLDTLFPDGGAIPASSDPFNPSGLVLLNNPNAVGTNLSLASFYFYNDGTVGDPGWFNANTFAPAGNVVLSPEVSFAIRNRTGATSDLVIAGDVPMSNTLAVVSRSAGRQDNVIFNPLPIPVSLANSNLVDAGAFSPSSDPFNPTDTLLVFNPANIGINSAASSFYFYNDGTVGDEGWFNANTFEPADSVQLSGGGAFIIRKGTSSDSVSLWSLSIN